MIRTLCHGNAARILTGFLIFLLMISCSTMLSASAPQPPIDPTTYNIATLGQPSRLDPMRAYDAASGELIQNVAQTLIWWNDKSVVNFTQGIGHSLTTSEYADLTSYVPVLATSLPTMTNNYTAGNLDTGEYYTFTINTNARFQPWTAGNGSLIPSRNLTAADVVYSFRRQMVYDSYYAPTWMWFQSAFLNCSLGGFSTQLVGGPFSTYGNGTFRYTSDELSAGAMINNWCYPGPGPNNVSFHFQNPWAPNIMNQIFAQTWGTIVEPEWVMEHGGWNGSFFAGWSNLWHLKPTATRSEIDAWKDPAIYGAVAGSKYAKINPLASSTIMGTGPYLFTQFDQANGIWRIDAWKNAADASSYWANPTWSGNHVLTVIERNIASWPTRKMLFLEGEFDQCTVNAQSSDMLDLLVNDTHTPAPGINLVYNIPVLSNDMLLFNTNVTASSSYQSFVGYPTHKTASEARFMANDHIRRAFAWAINYTQYIQQAYLGEGLQQASWWVDGLSPPSYENTTLTPRNLDYTQMQNELNQAVVDGFNVSAEGFETTLIYNQGNNQRMIAEQLISQAFHTLNPKYQVNVVGWGLFLAPSMAPGMAADPGFFEYEGPGYCLGWLADFADAHDFAQPIMFSKGSLAISQGPPFPADQSIIDGEINAALIEANTTQRMLDYQDLQARYYNDALSLPLVQPTTRRFARDWVQGWYFNALYPGLYAYDIYKSVPSAENVDVDITGTVTPQTPTYPVVYIYHNQMRIGNGNTNPASTLYTIHVTRNDNNNNIATLYSTVALAYTNLAGAKAFANGTYVALAPGGSTNVTLTWWADGTQIVIQGNSTGILYKVNGEAYPINQNANDTTLNNNVQAAGNFTAKTLTGDITGDGVVDIYDAIRLAVVFGSRSGDKKYNADADLNSDGFVDIYDAIILAGNFNAHVP